MSLVVSGLVGVSLDATLGLGAAQGDPTGQVGSSSLESFATENDVFISPSFFQ